MTTTMRTETGTSPTSTAAATATTRAPRPTLGRPMSGTTASTPTAPAMTTTTRTETGTPRTCMAGRTAMTPTRRSTPARRTSQETTSIRTATDQMQRHRPISSCLPNRKEAVRRSTSGTKRRETMSPGTAHKPTMLTAIQMREAHWAMSSPTAVTKISTLSPGSGSGTLVTVGTPYAYPKHVAMFNGEPDRHVAE